jgi:CubicO group peptidase (beta-lactamase class C family)
MVKTSIICITALILSTATLLGQEYFPAEKWEKRSASEFGIDEKKITTIIDSAMSYEYIGPKDLVQAILKGFEREPYHKILGPVKERGGPAGMIIKDGYIIAEWGDVKRVDMTFSVTKSYLSTIAGLAIDQKLISGVHQPVNEYVWDGSFAGAHNSKITWDHLLTQSSDWSGQLWGGYDWNDRPPKEGNIDDWKFRKLVEPGTVMEYNDVRVNLLAYSLLQVWRNPLPVVLKEKIMDPIGASTTWRWYGYDNSWSTVDGLQMQSVSGGGHSGGGLFINTEDHARFGLLFLRDGNWNGKQLISKDWINQAIQPSKAESSYGYMWWLPGDRMKNLSKTGYYAAGFGGNYIIVEPDKDLLIVLRWCDPSNTNKLVGMIHDVVK